MSDAPKDCDRCPRLCASRKQVVNSAGPVPARVMAVAQNPGFNEEQEGIPLSPSGWSGSRFKWLIENHTDWRWEDIRRANIVRCRPPRKPDAKGDMAPTASEVKECSSFLRAEIEAVNPDIILAIGEPALRWFFPGAKMSVCHGQQMKWTDGRIVVPMWHPAAATPNRRPELAEVMRTDYEKLRHIAGEMGKLGHYRLLSPTEITQWMSDEFRLARQEGRPLEFAFDYETTNPDWHGTFQSRRASAIGFSVCWREGEAVYCASSPEFFFSWLNIATVDCTVIAHNAKFEYTVSKAHGITLSAPHCTKLMAYVLRKPSTGLKDLSWNELGIKQVRFEEVDWSDQEAVAQYGAADSDMTLRLYHRFTKELKEQNLWKVYDEIERPLVPVLADMEIRGIRFDAAPMAHLGNLLESRQVDINQAIGEIYPHPINWNSHPEKENALFGPPMLRVGIVDELKGRKTKEGDAEGIRVGAQTKIEFIPPGLGLPILEKLPSGAPKLDIPTLHKLTDLLEAGDYGERGKLPGLLVEQASIAKFMNTVVTKYPVLVQEDGCLHTTFVQAGAWEEKGGDPSEAPDSARLASQGPNLQNVPHHGDTRRPYLPVWSKWVRRCFVAGFPTCSLCGKIKQEPHMEEASNVHPSRPLSSEYTEANFCLRNLSGDILPETVRSLSTEGLHQPLPGEVNAQTPYESGDKNCSYSLDGVETEDGQRIYSRSSERRGNALCSPADNAGPLGQIARSERGSPSQEWNKDGQPTGELGTGASLASSGGSPLSTLSDNVCYKVGHRWIPSDYVLLKADIGQQEPRIAAYVSGDALLLDELDHGDIYCPVATLAFGREITKRDTEERQIGKRIFMGWLNGSVGPSFLDVAPWLKMHEARRIARFLTEKYARFTAFREEKLTTFRETGYIENYFGHRRYLPGIFSSNKNERATAEREAIIVPIQGTAAGMMKIWMVRVDTRLVQHNYRADLRLTVHDELVLRVHRDDLQTVAALVATAFDNIIPGKFAVEMAAGPNWGDMTPVLL